MMNEVANGDGRRHGGKLGKPLTDVVVEVNNSVEGQNRHAGGSELFRRGGDVENRIGSNWNRMIEIGGAVPARKHKLPTS